MALSGLEWVVVLGIVALIFLWSPKKLPEFARALGQARKEFDKAMHEVSTQASIGPSSTTDQTDEQLALTAKKLGISTEGKSKEQLSQEIISKASTK